MTTQACRATIITTDGSMSFLVTGTDGVWNALLDAQNSKQLYEAQLGKSVLKAYGNYTAGSALFRIRNLTTKQVKEMWLGTMPKGTGMSVDCIEKFNAPITVETNDVIEVFPLAAPT